MNYFTSFLRNVVKSRAKKLALSVLLAVFGYVQGGFAQSSGTDEPIIYGFHGYSQNTSDETDLGLYTITSKGETTMVWPDNFIGATGTYVSLMWPQNNELHTLFGNKSTYFHLTFDFETGELIGQTQIDVKGDNAYKYIRRGAYNPKDGYIYGYSWNADETVDYFVKTPASDPSQVTIIREMPKDFVACAANCFNPEDNCMYGIDVYKALVRVDVHGNFSYTNLITPSDKNLHGVVAGLVYSPKEKCYYWNARYEDYSSEYVKIDPTKTTELEVNGVKETYIVTESIRWFNYLDAYVSLFTLDSTGSADGPVAPEMVSFNFPDGATTGSIVYKMPTQLANGDAAPASMKWEATDGVNNTTSGTAAPGEEVTVNYSNLESREYTFWFRAYNGDAPGVLDVNTTWIGNDVPSVPTNITLSPAGTKDEYIVKWNPVTKGAHNAYLNLDKLTYMVYLNGETLIATVKENEATVKIESGEDEMSCFVVVYAIADNKVSEPGYSPNLFVGNGWNLPYTIEPTSQQVQMMTYINPEDDALGWRPFICPPDTPTFYTGSSNVYPGNDWLITPHFKFPDKDAVYELSYDIAEWNAEIGEDFYDIWVGTEPTAEGIMMQQIMPKSQPQSMMFERMSAPFKVPEAGAYYIGFRCLSNPQQGGILLKSITIKQLAPGAVDEISDSKVSVYGEKGRISIKGSDNSFLNVYSLDGVCVYSGTTSEDMAIYMHPGVYIAVCDGKSYKVIVK